MGPDMIAQAAEYSGRRKRRKRWQKLVSCLGAAVVFCTTYALILPAITMESDYICGVAEHRHDPGCYEIIQSEQFSAELVCTPQVHIHTPECYDQEGHVICGLADRLIHRHDAGCYYNGELICPLPEVEEHIHDETCFQQTRELTCTLDEDWHEHDKSCFEYQLGGLICGMEPQEGHKHTDECWEWTDVLSCELDGDPEHQHTDTCYTKQQGSMLCAAAESAGHTHSDGCREKIAIPVCPLTENPEGHRHGEECYTVTTTLICPLEQIAVHTHTEECYDEDGALTCKLLSAMEHQHTDECLSVTSAGTVEKSVLICGMEEHVHGEACMPDEEPEESTPEEDNPYICGLPEHHHEADCFDAAGQMVCELEEHVHGETCAEPEVSAEAKNIMEQIDALPSADEVAAILMAYEESDYWEGYEKYFFETAGRVRTVYCYYEELTPEQQAQVANADKLLELEWLWNADTLDPKDTVTVYQVNRYSQAKATLVYGGSVGNKLGGSMSYAYWHAIIVEKSSSGQLYVSQVITATTSKRNCAATTAGGFVLLVHETSVNTSAGDYVEVSFDYTKTAAYNSAGYGTITFTAEAPADKDNTNKLDTVDGADTRGYIEVNLYDYGSNINENYNSNKKYPGFQQGGGEKNGSSLAGSNFGDNITADLSAGTTGVTNGGGDINATFKDASGSVDINHPISGAMQTTLGADGYPALSDGTSLSYLFSNNTYATKKNTQSINGLFKYNAATSEYSFNSRENHAQFNSADDTFTLYKQIITPNFTMYPFGNFMPLNDIVHDAAQVSTMDRDYLVSIANSAQSKYNSGAGDAYGTLATSMNSWINKMDAAYSEGWTIATGANEYFKYAATPDIDFTKNTTLLENTYTIDYDEPTNFFFGMEIKMNFMQPKNGCTGTNGAEPMVFYFTGDDDVWVYIDGVLFLDLSGIHRHVGGEIDFVNGLVKYYALDPSTGDVSSTPYKTVTFSEILNSVNRSTAVLNEKGTFQNYSHHTFNFYYMERGAGSGVCRMNFNFPLLQKNAISVTKELSSDSVEQLPLLGNPDFKFQVLREDGTPFIGADVAYEIYDPSGNKVGGGVTDANGVFSIKANQTAVFSEIAENAGKYFVRELLDTSIYEQYGTITVDGESTTTNHDITVGTDSFTGVNSPLKDMSDGSTVFNFNNRVTVNKMGGLSITKTLTANTGQTGRTFDLSVMLDDLLLPVGITYQVGDETRTVTETGIITLAPGETAVISNVLAGSTFTVKETDDSAQGYQVRYTVDSSPQQNQATGTVGLETTVNVVVNNTELGTAVSIPVQKMLTGPDGQEHTYTFTLTQVTDQTGTATADPPFTQDMSISVTDEPVTSNFVIDYPQNGSGTYYYKIVETSDPNDTMTVYDSSVYVVQVTVSAGENGALTAAVTAIWKDGTLLDGSPPVSFTNQFNRYELPETGGGGTQWFYAAGLLLMAAAGLVLYSKKRGKGASASP